MRKYSPEPDRKGGRHMDGMDQVDKMNETNESGNPTEQQKPAKEGEVKQTAAQNLYDTVEIFAIAITLVLLIFTFIIRVAVVNGPSMMQTLTNGDKMLVAELFYKPKQGDIIVCQSQTHGMEEPLVKRVIATAGQTVKIDFEKWKVTVDGVELDEPYIKVENVPMVREQFGESYTVPDGCVFVMGDNRNNSLDSRSINVGPIDERLIVGKVIFRLFPNPGTPD